VRKPARRGWRGYAFSAPIAGSTIPHRVQNLVIRSYAERHGLLFLLSVFEYHHEGSFMMLESLYETLPAIEGILFYSLNMLPPDRAARRRLYDAVLGSKAGLRFALEELQILKEADVALIEDIIAVRALSGKAQLGLLSR
jgi:sporadic carbohydrate cluster protein (TIGR04323 family)